MPIRSLYGVCLCALISAAFKCILFRMGKHINPVYLATVAIKPTILLLFTEDIFPLSFCGRRICLLLVLKSSGFEQCTHISRHVIRRPTHQHYTQPFHVLKSVQRDNANNNSIIIIAQDLRDIPKDSRRQWCCFFFLERHLKMVFISWRICWCRFFDKNYCKRVLITFFSICAVKPFFARDW